MPEIGMSLDEFREEISSALAEGGTRHFLRLTDEEISVLDPPTDETSIVATPHLSSLALEQRQWVMATALRSLVAREVVEVTHIEKLEAILHDTREDLSAQVDMRIQPDVDLVLTLRRTAARVLSLRRETADGTAYAYTHVHTPNLLLLERVTSGGLHLFTLASNTRDVAVLLRAFIDPFGIAVKDGAEYKLDPSMLDHDGVGPLAGIIDNARLVGHFVLLADEPGPMMLSYATDAAVWVVTVDEPLAPTGIRAQEVSGETLTQRIAGLLV